MTSAKSNKPLFERRDRSETVERPEECGSMIAELLGQLDAGATAEVVRILAARLGQYERRYGKVRIEETLASLHPDTTTCEQVADRIEGIRTLVGIVMLVKGV